MYALPGLDAEAAANLAERILQRHVPDPKQREIYAANPALPRLLKLLDGSPLALEVVLSNLARQTPEAILAALEAGDLNIDSQAQNPVLSKKERRTQTILGFIEYAYSNLDANAQRLLLVLFPFTGVVWEGMLEKYINHLQAQPALENLLLNSLHVVLQSVKSWGLLTQHEKLSGFLRIQPVLPYFLKIRLAQEPEEVKQALIIAFRLYYSEIGKVLSKFFDSERPHEQLIGQLLTQLEYENICNALRYALDAQESVSSFNDPISKYLESMHEHKQYIVLGEQILARLETYPSEKLAGQIGVEMACLIDDIARRQILMNQYTASAATYQRALSIFEQNETLSERSKSLGIASIYHQLGYVMQKQRQWISSRSFYQKALAIYIKLNHRDKLAGTYYQLGRVDYEEREWVQAEKHYQRALALSIEFNDRHDQSLIYHGLGMVAQRQRDWMLAEEYYQQASNLKIEFKDRYRQASTYNQLGVVAQEQGQWVQAEVYYQQSLTIYIEFNDSYEQAGIYHNLGYLAQRRQQWAQAEAYYQQSLAIYIDLNNRYEQAHTYYNLGLVAEEQEKWQLAYENFSYAMVIYIEFADKYHFHVIKYSLHTLWVAHPDETVLPTLAQALGITVDAALAWLTTADGG